MYLIFAKFNTRSPSSNFPVEASTINLTYVAEFDERRESVNPKQCLIGDVISLDVLACWPVQNYYRVKSVNLGVRNIG